MKRRSKERHEYIHGIHTNSDNADEQQDTSVEESEDDKIIGDPGRGIDGDIKSCASLRDTSDEEDQDNDPGIDEWGKDSDSQQEDKAKKDGNGAQSQGTDVQATEGLTDDNSEHGGKTNQQSLHSSINTAGRRKKQTTLNFGGNSDEKRGKLQSTDEDTEIQQNESSQSLVTQPPPKPPTPTTPPRYKAVNAKSTNRRQCLRMSTYDVGDKTPESNNRARYMHKHETRVTLKLSISGSDEPFQKVKEAIMEFLKEASQIDDKIMLLSWYEKGKVLPIGPNSKMPPTVTATHKYIHRLFTPKLGQDAVIYPQLRLGHDIDFHTLRDELSHWLSSYGHGLFYNMLQAEDGTDIGWLLYSTRDMDAGALADELSDTIGINVGLRYKGINTGTKSANQHNIVRALVVEASAAFKWEVQAALLNLYSRKIKQPHEYLNGIRLRFVKMKKSGVNQVEKCKMEKLKQRQKEFLDTVTSHPTHDIIQIDYSPKAGIEPTLRQMIMGVKSKASGYPLFHCIDMDWKREGFVFQFSSTLAEEAETAIITLLPLLEHLHPGIDVKSYFTSHSAKRCAAMEWDERKGMIIDKSAPEETEDIEEEENLMGFEFSV